MIVGFLIDQLWEDQKQASVGASSSSRLIKTPSKRLIHSSNNQVKKLRIRLAVNFGVNIEDILKFPKTQTKITPHFSPNNAPRKASTLNKDDDANVGH